MFDGEEGTHNLNQNVDREKFDQATNSNEGDDDGMYVYMYMYVSTYRWRRWRDDDVQ